MTKLTRQLRLAAMHLFAGLAFFAVIPAWLLCLLADWANPDQDKAAPSWGLM